MENLKLNKSSYLAWEQAYKKDLAFNLDKVLHELSSILFLVIFIIKNLLSMIKNILFILILSDHRLIKWMDESKGIYEEN
jgi:hypothetical protein